MLYRKHYKCSECGQEWHDTWECLCNDRCPVCRTEIEPDEWEEVGEDDDEEDEDNPSSASRPIQ